MNLNDKIGVAVVGTGRVGKSHLDAIRLNPDTTRLVAVVDADESEAESMAKIYNTKFYTSVEAALNNCDIQAMVVSLPNYLHKPVGLQIMETGRHVLIEKPMAMNLAEGKELVEKAQKKGVVLMVGQSIRFLPGLREAKLRMKEEIGDPFNLIYIMASSAANILGLGGPTEPSWRQDVTKTGGGSFLLSAPHPVDFTLWMYEGRKPIRVYSEARSINPNRGGMDEIVITISFDDGTMATNYISSNTNPRKWEGLITGPKGSVSFILGDSPVGLVGVFSCDLYINGSIVRSGDQEPHNLALQMREFSEAILQKREPMVKNSEILTQLAILDAAQKSAETHQPVPISDT